MRLSPFLRPYEWEISTESATWFPSSDQPAFLEEPEPEVFWSELREDGSVKWSINTNIHKSEDQKNEGLTSQRRKSSKLPEAAENTASSEEWGMLPGRSTYASPRSRPVNRHDNPYRSSNLNLEMNQFVGRTEGKDLRPPSRCPIGAVRIDTENIAWVKISPNHWESRHERYYHPDAKELFSKVTRTNTGMVLGKEIGELPPDAGGKRVGAVMTDAQGKKWKHVNRYEWYGL